MSRLLKATGYYALRQLLIDTVTAPLRLSLPYFPILFDDEGHRLTRWQVTSWSLEKHWYRLSSILSRATTVHLHGPHPGDPSALEMTLLGDFHFRHSLSPTDRVIAFLIKELPGANDYLTAYTLVALNNELLGRSRRKLQTQIPSRIWTSTSEVLVSGKCCPSVWTLGDLAVHLVGHNAASPTEGSN